MRQRRHLQRPANYSQKLHKQSRTTQRQRNNAIGSGQPSSKGNSTTSKGGHCAIPRVAKATLTDCCIVQIVASPSVPRPVEQAPATGSQSGSPRVNVQSSAARPHYIWQDEYNDDPLPGRQRIIPYEDKVDPLPGQRQTRSATRSIMQEAMFACVDIYKPDCILSQDLGLL